MAHHTQVAADLRKGSKDLDAKKLVAVQAGDVITVVDALDAAEARAKAAEARVAELEKHQSVGS